MVYSTAGRPIKGRSENQQKLIEEFDKNDMVFAVGPAGTGKTYLSIALAVKALKEKTAKKIVLSRPAVEAGEKLGFLPGDMKEKIDPYLQPLYDALEDMIPAELLFTVPIGDYEKVEALEGVKVIGHITNESLGTQLITRDNQEFEIRAQGWNPLKK